MVAIVRERDLQGAIEILRRYGVNTPIYSALRYNNRLYYVFEKAPAAALMLVQLEKGVKFDELNGLPV